MGYMIAFSPCCCCHRMFAYNPHRVPSTRAFTGEREPVCESCMAQVNAKRQAMGQEPFPILPGAYEAGEETDG